MQFVKLNIAAYRNFLDSAPEMFVDIRYDDPNILVKFNHDQSGSCINKGMIPIPDKQFDTIYFRVRMVDDETLLLTPVTTKLPTNIPAGVIVERNIKSQAETSIQPEYTQTQPDEFYAPETIFEMNIGNEVDSWREERSKRWEQQVDVMALFTASPAQPIIENLSGRRVLEKVISVPVSFDHRRGMGSRSVEVTTKKRKLFKPVH